MIEKTLLRRNIKKTAKGDFSTFMTQADNKEVAKVLEYATKKANQEQKQMMKDASK